MSTPPSPSPRFLHGDLADPAKREFYCAICDSFTSEAHLESAHPREKSVDRFLHNMERYGGSGRENWFDGREDVAIHKLKKAGGKFFRWLAQQTEREDPIGDLAGDAIRDEDFPRQAIRLDEILTHLATKHVHAELAVSARAAWAEFAAQDQ